MNGNFIVDALKYAATKRGVLKIKLFLSLNSTKRWQKGGITLGIVMCQ